MEKIEEQSKLNHTPPLVVKKKALINQNQRSNWSTRLYCKYAVTNNPAKVIGIRPNMIPNKKTSIIFLFKKGKKRGNIYPYILIHIAHKSQ